MSLSQHKESKQYIQSGFTLIEILVVLAIIGILASVVVPSILDNPDKARVIKAQQDIKTIESAMQMYKLDNFVYPSTDQGIEALVDKPTGGTIPKNWKEGGYLKDLPEDPWGNPYQYEQPGRNGPIDIYSLGADGQPDGDDMNADIGNWKEK